MSIKKRVEELEKRVESLEKRLSGPEKLRSLSQNPDNTQTDRPKRGNDN